MLDVSKAQKLKLANSRKRFKELQELKKKKDAIHNGPDLQDVGVTHIPTTTSTNIADLEHSSGTISEAPQQNDFTIHGDSCEPTLFFDNFSQSYSTGNSENCEETTSTIFNYFNKENNEEVNLQEQYDQNYSLFSLNNQHSYVQETRNIINPSMDDPELKRKYFHTANALIEDELNQSKSYEDDLSLGSLNLDTSYSKNNDKEHSFFAVQDCSQISQENSDMNQEHSNEVHADIVSNTENTQGLSNQLAELTDSKYNTAGSITDMEKRYFELISLLENEKVKCEQQHILITNLQSIIDEEKRSRNQFNMEEITEKANEVIKLKGELECHLQTVTLLVNEKSDLLNKTSELEANLKQKNTESEELQARLKASRSRAAELERELNTLKSEQHKNQNAEQQQAEFVIRLREECNQLRDKKEELLQDLLEVEQKYKTVNAENAQLQQLNEELSGNFALAQIKIQQITSGVGQPAESQIDDIIKEKQALEKQLVNMDVTLKAITKERDESSIQYQQYAQQLNGQLTTLSARLEQLQEQNDILVNQEQNRIRHIGDLERQLQSLQNMQNEQLVFSSNKTGNDTQLKTDLEAARETISLLEGDNVALKEKYTRMCNECAMLTRELQAKNGSVGELENEIERLRGNQPDSAKLLAAMESDKVAAAAAVRQNMEMKEQVQGMREVIAKIDNDKLDLTEKLTFEISSNKELLEKLQRTELQLQRLTDAIEIKDRELSHLRANSEELDKHILEHEQLNDRLRNYEAQDNNFHVLQNELQEAKQVIIKLTNEINLSKNENESKEIMGNFEQIPRDNLGEADGNVTTLRETHPELEKNVEFEAKLQQNMTPSNFEVGQYTHKDHDDIVLDKEEAMRHLEEKFKRTMQDIANLTEEKQRLEHLVLQLQGETETIGEYVALYQQQRMVLKQRELEKDLQLKQLASDREQIKLKLEKLNELIRKLVIEKGSIPQELLKHHESLTSQSDSFCEEHIKIHKEISKLHDNTPGATNGIQNSETAEEIIALLSEIKSSNLVEPNNIHHCAWCSGQLMTV